MGLIPHSQVKREIAKANFTILVRPDRRSSHAGFPTKLAESFACGTPVILNLTSDMNLYLKDMKNAVICKDNSIMECKNSIRKALSLNKIDLYEMKKEAKKSLEELEYRFYLSDISDFLAKIRSFNQEV